MNKWTLTLASMMTIFGAFAEEEVVIIEPVAPALDAVVAFGKKIQTQPIATPAPAVKSKDSTVKVGATYAHLWQHTPSHFDGNLGGLEASYDYRPVGKLYQGVHALYRQGNETLENSTTKIDLLELRAEARAGWTHHYDKFKTTSTLFTGLGYNYYSQDLTNSILVWDYNDFYIPVGFMISRDINANWKSSLNFTWMPQVYTAVDFGSTSETAYRTKRELANFLVEIPVAYKFTSWDLEIKPFFEYWQEGQAFDAAVNQQTNMFLGVTVSGCYDF